MRILIVDDNPSNLIIIEQILRKAGYRDVIKMNSAVELFDLYKEKSEDEGKSEIDLILMDMMMPEVDGIEACRRIQLHNGLKDIPVIMVTAIGDVNKLAEALDAGAIDYVTKPINRVELLARIRVALRLKKEKDLHEERDKKIKNELELAMLVQTSVLSMPIETDKISITAAYQPSSELAGDLYAWHRIDEDRYGVILLDVMGHGISSSLVSMFISSVLKDTIIKYCDPVLVIEELNRYMNQLYFEDQLIQYYFTAIYVLIDTNKKTIEYVNAGHPPGLLVYDDGSLKTLEQGSSAVGLFPEIVINKELVYYEGNVEVILFTDGLMEIMDPETEESMESIVDRLKYFKGQDADDIINQLIPEGMSMYRQDDICLVFISC